MCSCPQCDHWAKSSASPSPGFDFFARSVVFVYALRYIFSHQHIHIETMSGEMVNSKDKYVFNVHMSLIASLFLSITSSVIESRKSWEGSRATDGADVGSTF